SAWGNNHRVAIVDPGGSPHVGNVEEPEYRESGPNKWLFFNDEKPSGDKDLLHASWDAASQSFHFLGPLSGPDVSTPAVDGNPTMDEAGHFYFVSTRSYLTTGDTIYGADFAAVPGAPPTGALSGVHPVDGLSRKQPKWVTMGVHVTWDGE